MEEDLIAEVHVGADKTTKYISSKDEATELFNTFSNQFSDTLVRVKVKQTDGTYIGYLTYEDGTKTEDWLTQEKSGSFLGRLLG